MESIRVFPKASVSVMPEGVSNHLAGKIVYLYDQTPSSTSIAGRAWKRRVEVVAPRTACNRWCRITKHRLKRVVAMYFANLAVFAVHQKRRYMT